jgi:hypothetical protein
MTAIVEEVVRWPLRSLLAGSAGTAALSLFYAIDRRMHPLHRGPLDYDDSLIPGEIVANILNLSGVTGRDEAELALALRWSYGSAFGLWHGLLRQRLREPSASAAFGATLMAATLTLFPLLGRTPPPWHWPRGYLASSFASHAAYVGAVAAVDARPDSGTQAPRRIGGWTSSSAARCAQSTTLSRAQQFVHSHPGYFATLGRCLAQTRPNFRFQRADVS